MAALTAASLSASCLALRDRAVSTAAGLNHTLQTIAPEQQSAAAALEQLFRSTAEEAARLQKAISATSVIVPAARTVFSGHFENAEMVLAAMDKQLQRLASAESHLSLDSTVLDEYKLGLERQNLVLEVFQDVLQQSSAEQNVAIENDNFQDAITKYQEAQARIMQRRDIIRPVAVYDELPPQYSEDDPDAESPNQPKSKGNGFLSGVSESWNALTAAMRPKSEPLVSPLCHAARLGDVKQIHGLLDQGVNINGRNEEGKTALICATEASRSETVKLLIVRGASLSAKSSTGKTALFAAAETGSLDMAQILLAHGSNPNERSASGQPGFSVLVKRGDTAMIRLFLASGVDANTRDNTGQPVLLQAMHSGNWLIAQLLVDSGADVNSRDISGRAALVVAAFKDQLGFVEYLLSRGADANIRDHTGKSLLCYSVEKNQLRLLELLLEHGADANVRDLMGCPILCRACDGPDLQMAKMLLDNGADANQHYSRSTRETLLLHAVVTNRWELASDLLGHGADPNRLDLNGRAPLLEAMLRNNTGIVQLLLQHGADRDQESRITPIALARVLARQDISQLFPGNGS